MPVLEAFARPQGAARALIAQFEDPEHGTITHWQCLRPEPEVHVTTG